MKLERFKNTKRNSIWGILSKLILLFFPFITRATLIKVLGVEYLGLNGLFTSILSLLNLTELGVGSAIVFSMYKPLAQNDEKKICALMNLYKKLYRYIGFIVLIIGLIIMPIIPKLISSEVPSDINIYLLYIIYLANSVISYWLFAYKNCLLQVYQRTDITAKITIILNVLMYMLQILVLSYIKNYYVYVITIPIFSILLNIINAYFSTRLFPQYKCRGKIGKEELIEIKKRVFGLMITKIAYASRNAFDSIVISFFLGLEIVAIYNNYYYIISALSAILIIFPTSMAAGIGNSLVTESKEKNIKDLKIINFLYMTIAGFCFTCTITLYQPFMKAWVGEELLFSNAIMILFSVYFLVEKSLNVIGQYFDAAGLWWIGKWKGVIEAGANIILNIAFCYLWGAAGVVAATIVTIIFIGFPLTVYYVYKYFFNKPAFKFIINEYIYISIFMAIGAIVYFVCALMPAGENMIGEIIWMIMRLIITIGITSVLYLTIFGRFKLFKETLNWIKIHFK